MKRFKLAFIVAMSIVILDQTTKVWVSSTLKLWSGRNIISDFFNLVHFLNRGAAWGFLNNETIHWQRPLFVSVTIVALCFVLYMLKVTEESNNWMIFGLGFIAGGAIGNLIDRIYLGAVVDFLDFFWGNYHWPAFNVADIALTVGAGCIILSTLLNKQRQEAI